MALDFEHPDDLGGEFLKAKGTYHFAVLSTDENPTFRGGDKKGQLRDGFEIEAEVLAGAHQKQTIRLFFRNPNLSHKDQGSFCRRVQGRFLEAVCLVDPSKRGQRVSIELKDATARQFIATITGRAGDDGKEYLELDSDQVFHVDDPAAPKCELSQAALKLLPASLRRKPESFGPPKQAASGSASGNGNGAAGAATKAPTAPQQTPVAAGIDIDDL